MTTARRKIVLASQNADKIEEMSQLCEGLPFEIGSAREYPGLPEVIEDGTTEVGNASRKAIITAAYTGEIAVADDTAFQIPSLNDLPDIFASRFAGPKATYQDNVQLVLDLMSEVPDGFRQARFVTAVAWVDPRPSMGHRSGGEAPRPAKQRWLHNPFARAIHVRNPEEEAAFWNRFYSRREAWDRYRASLEAVMVTHGADSARLTAVIKRLLAPYLTGERLAGAPAAAMQLPDTRIWTTAPPADEQSGSPEQPLTLVTPTGLPADAPGHGVNEDFWLEITAEGRLLGEISRQPLGRLGFGYDPIFRIEPSGRTLAQCEPAEKNAVSHRGRALRRLLTAVSQVYQSPVTAS